ncbi:MAG TPA: transglycosylase SLT domain-containing protein [Pyrinomonadaceae bacterium]|nr:transglycosylase SLT domain-containing protein [Pyrinomonadaceae bacterium]
MFFLAHQALLLTAALALAPACTRVEAPRNSPEAAAVYATAEAVVIPADEQTDDALAVTRRMDGANRSADGALPQMPAQEHMRRAGIYHANRAFDEARAHWRAIIERHPEDSNVPAAHFGIGRSLFQERRYEEALPVFENLGNSYIQTPAGRDGFYYVAATLLRLDRPAEAAARYAEYAERFPNGERIENALLNVIDSLREAGKPDEALPWIERTRERFRGKPADASALFARLRLEVARGDWQAALRSGDEMSRVRLTRDVNTTAPEIAYLRAYSLERLGRTDEALKAYQSIADSLGSYYGGRATERMRKLGAAGKASAAQREARVRGEVQRAAGDYPASFREVILRSVAGRGVDARLVLAIMRQESGFNTRAKSPAAARGLLQLTPEIAAKYAPQVKIPAPREEDLYRPEVNVLLASAYLAELGRMFPGLPEAVAASYNGGEDNVVRWVRRAVHDDPGVFTSEVGFTESKDYVNKVMANFRAYKMLYTEDLKPRR